MTNRKYSYSHYLSVILLLLVYCVPAKAQVPFAYEVREDFMAGYPIVTDVYKWYIEPIEIDTIAGDDYLIPTDIILETNGKSVKGAKGVELFLEAFYTDSIVSLKFLRWPDRTINFKFRNHFYNNNNDCGDVYKHYRIPLHFTEIPQIRVVRAQGIDFADYKSYDLLLDSDDPLVDEAILNQFISYNPYAAKMKRDKENPDIIFRLTRNAENSISTSYIPPTKETINIGSTTNPVYNYITRTTSYVTRQRYKTVEHAGHTEATNLSNLYMEIVALDAKKMNDPNQTVAPEIWKMVYSAAKVNDNRPDIDKYKEIAIYSGYPFEHPYYATVLPIFSGAKLQPGADNKSLVVMNVAPDTPASELGLMPMDIILKINGKNEFKRKDMSDKGWALEEKKFPMGELESQLGLTAFRSISLILKTAPKYWKETIIEPLDKPTTEFLIERNGKKIKLKGNLFWPNIIYNPRPSDFIERCREYGRTILYLTPRNIIQIKRN